jgi:N-acetylneuraminate synthase
VRGADAIFQALGTNKAILENERPVLKFARASVVAIKPIAAGERLSEANIWVKRPADGEIPAKSYKQVPSSPSAARITAGSSRSSS